MYCFWFSASILIKFLSLGKILSELEIAVDIPDGGPGGTSTTGNVVRSLLGVKDNREFLIQLVQERHQAHLREIIKRLWVILRLVASDRRIHIDRFSTYCNDTYIKLKVNKKLILAKKFTAWHQLLQTFFFVFVML